MEAHYYNVDLKWMSDRKGLIFSPELESKIEVATPPQFAKGIEGLWSPEHLLTAAVNSCFMTTFLAIAENSGLEFINFECNAKGKLEQVDGKFLMTEILINTILKIKNAADEEKAIKILKKAEAACLISNSIKSKVTLDIHIKY
ncbi:MAG: OsmC family protein [Chitinophagaceae bacterium]|jgi:peroxiredoxin-like protein